jgi:purine-nucleoside phosphorylase
MPQSPTTLQQIKKSTDYINKITPLRPEIGIILGSGLGAFTNEIEIEKEIPYKQIPYFPTSGIKGHKGSLIFGRYRSKAILIMQGRVHFYEGYSMQEITYPIRVIKNMGVETLFLSNAAGGMNPKFNIGDLMVINDHINLMPNPLIGPHDSRFGVRFPDMSQVYDQTLIQMAFASAKNLSIALKQGCYVGVTGPTYETPAEYKFFRALGGDAVGMSTVPEVIVARQMSMKCLGISVITDLGVPGKIEHITHEMVQKAAGEAEPKMALLLKKIIESI